MSVYATQPTPTSISEQVQLSSAWAPCLATETSCHMHSSQTSKHSLSTHEECYAWQSKSSLGPLYSPLLPPVGCHPPPTSLPPFFQRQGSLFCYALCFLSVVKNGLRKLSLIRVNVPMERFQFYKHVYFSSEDNVTPSCWFCRWFP